MKESSETVKKLKDEFDSWKGPIAESTMGGKVCDIRSQTSANYYHRYHLTVFKDMYFIISSGPRSNRTRGGVFIAA